MTRRIDVLDHGYAQLVGHMVDFQDLDELVYSDVNTTERVYRVLPNDLTLDAQIARAARVSYAEGTKSIRGDAGLIDYLMRHRHTSPFEQITLKFQLKMPIVIAIQWLRHRTGSPNQESGRYSILRDEFYLPALDRFQAQHATNKQGSGELLDYETRLRAQEHIRDVQTTTYEAYEALLELGVSRELSRIVLPYSIYTTMVWEMDLHNLMHFLALRLDEHAQWEIRQMAQALYDLVQPLVPLAIASFENHVLNAVTISGDEVSIIREALLAAHDAYAEEDETLEEIESVLANHGLNKSRRREFFEKLGLLD